MKKLVIFDLDGTLADSLTDISNAVNRMLANAGYPMHSYAQYRYFVGEGMRTLVTRSLPEEVRNDEIIDRSLAEVMADYSNNCVIETRLYDGIDAMLDGLAAKGIRLAILSNKPDPMTQQVCAALLDKWPFEIIMGAGDRFPRKPAPDAALYIADSMGVDAIDVLYVGDSNVDMRTASSAGFTSAGVTWGFRTREELLENGADHTVDYPTEILSLV